MKKAKILIVDDELDIRESLSEILNDEGYEVHLAENASKAKKIQKENKLDLVLLDIWMPDCDGISLLKEWKKEDYLKCPVIMMSGHGNIDTAIEATKIGAFDFLEKPISLQKLLKTIGSSLSTSININKLNKDFIGLSEHRCIKNLREQLKQIKQQEVIFLKSSSVNFLNLILEYLFENDIYKLDDTKDLNLASLKQVQGKGINNLLLLKHAKLPHYNKNELIEKFKFFKKNNIKLILVDEEDDFLREVFSCMRIDNNSITLPIGGDSDLIPEYAKAFLEFYLSQNINIGYKSFDISALNTLRINNQFLDIDILDRAIISLLNNTNGEIIESKDINKILMNYDDGLTSKNPHDNLFNMSLKEARECFEKDYFKFHISKGNGATELSKISGIERTHLYRKLKKLGLKK